VSNNNLYKVTFDGSYFASSHTCFVVAQSATEAQETAEKYLKSSNKWKHDEHLDKITFIASTDDYGENKLIVSEGE